MKTRTDFITNSSSASFVVGKYYISGWQIERLHDALLVKDDKYWEISEDHDTIKGYTIIDNIGMDELLEGIGVPMEYVTFTRMG